MDLIFLETHDQVGSNGPASVEMIREFWNAVTEPTLSPTKAGIWALVWLTTRALESAIRKLDSRVTPNLQDALEDWLAVDAVSCEPFSGPNSLLTGKNTGNLAR
jgi:hypothetical protein